MPGSPLRQRLLGAWEGAGQFFVVSTCGSRCTTCTWLMDIHAVTAITHSCEAQPQNTLPVMPVTAAALACDLVSIRRRPPNFYRSRLPHGLRDNRQVRQGSALR